MSVNKVILIGRLGQDPIIRYFEGKKMATFSVATNERYTDKNGEAISKTSWHKITVYQAGLVEVVEKYIKQGMSIYVEGKLQYNKYTTKEGQERIDTAIVLSGYDSKLDFTSNNQYTSTNNDEVNDNDSDDSVPF